jgi:anaerobic dimethyl sulfoxide reductase subunit B (iron-sulfur subunit)
VIEVEKKVAGEWKMFWKPMACMHCGEAACLMVCPTKAISKRNEDGIVLVSKDLCIGCMECFRACPFGAPQLDEDGKMQKCTLCAHKTASGEGIPACVESCPSEAMYYGSALELSKLMRRRYSVRSIGRVAAVVNPTLRPHPFLP